MAKKGARAERGNRPLLRKYIKKIDDEPSGYPQLAAFIDSDPNFMMCRCFGTLHTRLLLYRQDELVTLENRLARLDREDSLTGEGRRCLTSRDLDGDVRQDLVNEIEKKLKVYDDLVLRFRSLNAMGAPTARNISSLAAWIDNEKPLCKGEMEFIHHREDLVTLTAGRETGWFNGLVAGCIKSIPCRSLRRLFSSEEQRQKTDDRYIHYVSRKRLGLLTAVVLAFVIALSPPIPILTFRKTERSEPITSFIAALGALPLWLLVFAMATRREILNEVLLSIFVVIARYALQALTDTALF